MQVARLAQASKSPPQGPFGAWASPWVWTTSLRRISPEDRVRRYPRPGLLFTRPASFIFFRTRFTWAIGKPPARLISFALIGPAFRTIRWSE